MIHSDYMIIVAVIMLLVQILLTVGAIVIWNVTRKNSPEQLPRLFFAVSAVRVFVSLITFAAGLYLIHDDISQVKIFTVITLLLYLLLLVFDTAYYYCSTINTK